MNSVLANLASFAWSSASVLARAFIKKEKLDVPVISVGNIVAGGVGKTELVIAIAKRLSDSGKKVAVLMRGYGSLFEAGCGFSGDFSQALEGDFPDEALVLLKKTKGVTAIVGADRYRNYSEFRKNSVVDVVILDDGFQHHRLFRDLDILVHDFSISPQVHRDFPSSFSSAGLRVSFSEIPKKIETTEWCRAEYVLTGFQDLSGRVEPVLAEAHAFCGIGNPARFQKFLETKGIKVLSFFAKKDHAEYSEADVLELAKRYRGETAVTTLKDWVKLLKFQKTLIEHGVRFFYAEIDVAISGNETVFWKKIDESVNVIRH